MLFSSQDYLAALNAVLVEHDLGLIEIVPENPTAAELKDGVIAALRAGQRGRFDEEFWVNKFNHADRLVQLNVVALAFNELGEKPMLQGEDWQPVRNPFVLRDIAGKISKATRAIERRHGRVVQIRASKLALQDWGIGELSEQANIQANTSPSFGFMAEMPHRASNTPKGTFTTGDAKLYYFENPLTIGSVTAGIDPPYKYPQVVVVFDQDEPLLIIRAEENALGGHFLCSLDKHGQHIVWGEMNLGTRDDFVRMAGELLLKIKHGEGGRVDIRPLKS